MPQSVRLLEGGEIVALSKLLNGHSVPGVSHMMFMDQRDIPAGVK